MEQNRTGPKCPKIKMEQNRTGPKCTKTEWDKTEPVLNVPNLEEDENGKL